MRALPPKRGLSVMDIKGSHRPLPAIIRRTGGRPCVTRKLLPSLRAFSPAMLVAERRSAGDVYKYVDERGNTLYTDKPIPGAVLVSTGAQRPPEVARAHAAPRSRPPATASSPQATSASRTARTMRASPRHVAKDLEAHAPSAARQARENYSSRSTRSASTARSRMASATISTTPSSTKQRIDSPRPSKPSAAPKAERARKLKLRSDAHERRPLDGVFFVALAPDNPRLCCASALQVSAPWVLPWRKISTRRACCRPSGTARRQGHGACRRARLSPAPAIARGFRRGSSTSSSSASPPMRTCARSSKRWRPACGRARWSSTAPRSAPTPRAGRELPRRTRRRRSSMRP